MSMVQMKNTAGFTLVELAISLMIIGLLIGGILKGEELIDNARVSTTIKQVQSYRAATVSFENVYTMLPGDVVSPTTRLPNCSAAPCSNAAAPGDGWIGPTYASTSFAISVFLADTTDNAAYWYQLAAAGMTNLSILERASAVMVKAPWEGAFGVVALNQNSGANGYGLTHPAIRGNYLFLKRHAPGAAQSSEIRMGMLLKPPLALQIDTKMDDGLPATGDVLAATFASPSNPFTGTNYNGAIETPMVNLVFALTPRAN